jgi:hypothetical protein
MDTRLFAVTRSFQGGATFASFDQEKFAEGVIVPIRKLLDTAPPQFMGITVVTCGEAGSKYAEEVQGGDTPTTHHIREAFPKEVASGRIVPVVCKNWGLNAGSGTAINEGIAIARQHGADKVLVWSKEIDLDGFMVYEMLCHMELHALRLVGYARNYLFERLQWMFAQNTCAIWDVDLLKAVDDMNPACDGDGKTTVSTAEFGEVPLAGMEDIEAYFRASAQLGEFVRWGVVGQRHPANWDTARKVQGTREYDDNAKKIARQGLVMDAYAKRIFPHMTPREVNARMMQVASNA